MNLTVRTHTSTTSPTLTPQKQIFCQSATILLLFKGKDEKFDLFKSTDFTMQKAIHLICLRQIRHATTTYIFSIGHFMVILPQCDTNDIPQITYSEIIVSLVSQHKYFVYTGNRRTSFN